MGEILLDSYRADAEHFYTTDPDYKRDVAEMCDIIQRDIHERVVAVDLEATLVSDRIGAFYNSKHERLEVNPFDRLRRPLSNELLQALVDAHNEVILWTSMISDLARFVCSFSGLKLPQSTGFVAREDYQRALLNDESGIQVLQKIVKKFGEPPSHCNPEGKTPAKYYADLYMNKLGVKIPSVLGVDVLIDDQASDHYKFGCGKFFDNPKEAARFVDVEPFVIGNELTLARYLRSERGLLAVVRQLPSVLAEVDSL
ncbi:MAG: hypothetical protein AAB953_02360 [Patescibacteria group bacterium]